MPASGAYRLTRGERLKSKLLTDRLFNGVSAFPLRMVYLPMERGEHQAPASIMVSVPKRCLRHAVDRNRVKRQVREAYRTNKHLLQPKEGQALLIAFIWMDSTLYTSEAVEHKVKNLLIRLNERL